MKPGVAIFGNGQLTLTAYRSADGVRKVGHEPYTQPSGWIFARQKVGEDGWKRPVTPASRSLFRRLRDYRPRGVIAALSCGLLEQAARFAGSREARRGHRRRWPADAACIPICRRSLHHIQMIIIIKCAEGEKDGRLRRPDGHSVDVCVTTD